MFEKGTRANTLHGILLIALFSFAAFYLAEVPFVKSLSFSPLIVGIILGMLYANSLRNKLPETWVPGISSAQSKYSARALCSTVSASLSPTWPPLACPP